MNETLTESECPCGRLIHRPSPERAPDLWLDNDGSEYCYPEADNGVDEFAHHEPMARQSLDSLQRKVT